MEQIFAKGLSVPLSTHFSSTHFDCHCKRQECEITIVDSELPEALESLWDIIGPFKIDSGFRCLDHNTQVGGQPHSKHTLGQAADCKSLSGKPGAEMAVAAEKVTEFQNGGIGTYGMWVHLDVRQDGPARWKGGTKLSLIVAC